MSAVLLMQQEARAAQDRASSSTRKEKRGADSDDDETHEVAIDDEMIERLKGMPRSKSIVEQDQVLGDVDEDAKKQKLKYIIHPKDKYKEKWDWFILFLVLYNCGFIPWNIAFSASSDAGLGFDYLVDAMFVLDITFTFFTGYFDDRGNEILDGDLIRKKYLRGWFWLELVAVFPFELVALAAGFSQSSVLVGLLKLPRLLRIARVAKKFDQLSSANIWRLVKLLMAFLILIHWVGCIWYMIGNMQSEGNIFTGYTWVRDQNLEKISCKQLYETNAWDNVPDPESNSRKGFQEQCGTYEEVKVKDVIIERADIRTRYAASIYWALTTMVTVGYGDITPKTTTERFFAMVMMLVGAIIYAFLFGNIGLLINNFDRANIRYRERMDSINEFIQFHDLPADLAKRIRDNVNYLWNLNRGFDANNVLADLPLTLRTEIAMFMYEGYVTAVPLFKRFSEGFVKSLVLKLKPQVCLPNDFVYREGEIGRFMYVIAKGKVEVVHKSGDPVYALMGEGSFFGETEPLLGGRRIASVRAITHCDLYFISKEDFLDVLKDFPACAQPIQENAFLRAEELRVRKELLHTTSGKEDKDSDDVSAVAAIPGSISNDASKSPVKFSSVPSDTSETAKMVLRLISDIEGKHTRLQSDVEKRLKELDTSQQEMLQKLESM